MDDLEDFQIAVIIWDIKVRTNIRTALLADRFDLQRFDRYFNIATVT